MDRQRFAPARFASARNACTRQNNGHPEGQTRPDLAAPFAKRPARAGCIGQLYLTTALVGLVLHMAASPAHAITLRVHPDEVQGNQPLQWDYANAIWRNNDNTGGALAFSAGDSVNLVNHNQDITLNVRENLDVREVQIRASNYLITGIPGTQLSNAGGAPGDALVFRFFGDNRSLQVSAGLGGDVVIMHQSGNTDNTGELVYSGDATLDSIMIRDGMELNIASGGRIEADSFDIADGSTARIVGIAEADDFVIAGKLHVASQGTLTMGANAVQVVNGGEARVSGRIEGNVAVDSGALHVNDNGRVDNVTNADHLVLRGRVRDVQNTGTITVPGAAGDARARRITNDLDAQGERSILDVEQGAKLTVMSGLDNAGGTTTVAGEVVGDIDGGHVTINRSGVVTGDIENTDRMESRGVIDGTLTATNDTRVSGSVTNLVGQSGTIEMAHWGQGQQTPKLDMTSLRNDGADMVVKAGGEATVSGGDATNTAGSLQVDGTLDVSGATGGQLRNSDTLVIADMGEVTGAVFNRASGNLTSEGTITGNLRNDGTANLSGMIGGRLHGQGTTVTDGNLEVERFDLTDNASLTVSTGDRLTLRTGTSRLDDNAGLVLQDDAWLDGNLRLDDDSGLTMAEGSGVSGNVVNDGTITLNGAAEMGGNLNNKGLLTAGAAGASLDVANLLTNDGEIRTAGFGPLVINAEWFENNGHLDGDVSVNANILNSGTWDVISDSQVNGTLRNTGTIDVQADLALNGNNITNENVLMVGAAGSISDAGRITNRAQVTVADGGTITADRIINADGSLKNDGQLDADVRNTGGALTSTGSITGQLINYADANLSGEVGTVLNRGDGLRVDAGNTLRVTGDLFENRNDGRATIAGTLISAEVINRAGGIFTTTGIIQGNFANDGEARLAGQAGGVHNRLGGTMRVTDDLAVHDFDNDGTVIIDSGALLASAGNPVSNNDTGTMAVRGTVAGEVDNTGTLDMQGSGRVDGAVLNSAGLVRVTGADTSIKQLENRGARSRTVIAAGAGLRVDDVLDNTGLAEIDGTLVAGLLTNRGTLDMGGAAVLGGQVENTGTARLAGTLAGDYANMGGGQTLVEDDLQVTGTLEVRDGRLRVGQNGVLTSANPVRITGGQMAVAGHVSGPVGNQAILRSDAGSVMVGGVTNHGLARLAGTMDQLTNSAAGHVFVHDDLEVSDGFVSQGTFSVAEGNTLTLGTAGRNTGKMTVAGRLAGHLNNQGSGNLVVRGQIDSLTNHGTAALKGASFGTGTNLDQMEVSGNTQITQLFNRGDLIIADGAHVTSTQALINAGGQTVIADGATFDGRIINSHTLVSEGRLTGLLRNNAGGQAQLGGSADLVRNFGQMAAVDNLDVRRLENNSRVTVASGATVIAADGLDTFAQGVTTIGGTVIGDMAVADGGTVHLTGTLDGALVNHGLARLEGQATRVDNGATGQMHVTGGLQTDQLFTKGKLTIQKHGNLAGNVVADGEVLLNGTVQGYVDTTGLLRGQQGRIGGDVFLRQGAELGGNLMIDGQLYIGGERPGPGLRSAGMQATPLPVAMLAAPQVNMFNTPQSAVIQEWSTITLSDGAHIQPDHQLTVLGQLIGDARNDGRLLVGEPGEIVGDVLTNGDFQLDGTISGNVVFAGGQMGFGTNGRIAGGMILNADYSLDRGQTLDAHHTVLRDGVTLDLAGTVAGNISNLGDIRFRNGAGLGALENGGTIGLGQPGGPDATLRVAGDVINQGVVDLVDGHAGDRLVIDGGLNSSGVYMLDTDIAGGTADRIEVTGGPLTGQLFFDITEMATGAPMIDQSVTLLKLDNGYGAQNDFTYEATGMPAPTERVVYLIARDDTAGEVQMISRANPAIGAISGNVALTQSLIQTVINRPSSPYTTGLGFAADDKACRVGSWGRALGGRADISGVTHGADLPNGERIAVDSDLHANYRGLQVGTDLGCYDGRFRDWTVVGGAIVGFNTGTTTQPVYTVNPVTGLVTDQLTSTNQADFDQTYAGVYVSATRGPLVVDLQLRREWTGFKLNNEPVPGSSGLMLTDAKFDSRATTVSGAVSYTVGLGDEDSGWSVTPTAGLAWTRTRTDPITFDDGSTLAIDDSQSRVGFVGAGLSYVKPADDGKSAMSLFASGTYYNDFSKSTRSTFSLRNTDGSWSVQDLESNSLGSYGEISIGASYVRVLDSASLIKQMNATIRLDGRTGKSLDSYGITGQVRLQF